MDNTYKKINAIFRTVLKDKQIKVVIFGSRARNDVTDASDFDFALDSNSKIEKSIMISLNEMFEESTIPYNVDIIDYNNVSKAMQDQINKYGKEWKITVKSD